jgi:predicted amidohydrolase
MRIGLVQPIVQNWDWITRAEYASNLIFRLRDQKPDIICLPELFPGYIPPIQECARDLKTFIICGEVGNNTGPLSNNYSNNVVLINPQGKVVGRYQKIFLMPSEKASGYKRGTRYKIFNTPLGKIGVLICADFPRVPETSGVLALGGADIIFVPSMSVKNLIPYWKLFLISRTIDNGIPTIYVNIANEFKDGETIYGGGQSSIVTPMPTEIRSLDDFYSSENIKPEDHILYSMENEEMVKVIEVNPAIHSTYRDEKLSARRLAQSIKISKVY